MGPRAIIGIIVSLLVVIIISSSLFVVNETERAILLRFGEVVKSDIAPGIHLKTPFVEKERKFDGRLLTVDARPERFLTAGKKYLVVDAFIKWRIKDVLAFYKATNGDNMRAASLLSRLTNDGLRAEFAVRTVQEVVSGERDKLMADITKILNEQAINQFGIEVVDVRIKGIDLPDDLRNNVYRRMSAEREREARELRSQGKELAEGIRADADRQKTVIEANAYRDAEVIRGEGDAIAASTYAKAFNKDPEFYAFTRSLKAYEDSFSGKGDILLLKPDSDFFRYLKNSKGR